MNSKKILTEIEKFCDEQTNSKISQKLLSEIQELLRFHVIKGWVYPQHMPALEERIYDLIRWHRRYNLITM